MASVAGSAAMSVRKLTGLNEATMVGAMGHVATTVTLSRDFKRATLMWREYRGDAWMYRVVKP